MLEVRRGFKMSIQLREDLVAIEVSPKPTKGPQQSEGGILLYDPAENLQPSIVGIVRHVGLGKSLDLPDGKRKEMDLKVGDKVTFDPGCGKERIINGVPLLIIASSFVTFVHMVDNLEVSIKRPQ